MIIKINQTDYLTIYFDTVSLLAVDAFMIDSETSFDFSNQEFIIPIDSNNPDFYSVWSDKFRQFYVEALPILINHLKELYPCNSESEKEFIRYNNTIKARAFDILRGFLPAGFSTNVAWTGTLHSVSVHLRKLMCHPLDEVRTLAIDTFSKLCKDYPNSFSESQIKISNNKYFYGSIDVPVNKFTSACSGDYSNYDKNDPYYNFVMLQSECLLDFGSWRDLQRHRNMSYLMPKLTTRFDFEKFYIDNLPSSLYDKAYSLLEEFKSEYDSLDDNDITKQYIVPMGFRCPILIQMHVHQAVYLAELRSMKTVHPTLRIWAQNLGIFLNNNFNIKCNVDLDTDNWTLKRGDQDIKHDN